MKILAGKLEDFGLKKFIPSHRHELCTNTVNQLKMASFLTFDPDQIANIMAAPGSFERCSKLYELIEKVAIPSNFLEALNSTNNGHVLKFIESVLMGSSSSGQTSSSKWGIWFNIPEPIDSFCGREDFLSQLHDKLQQSDNLMTEVTVLSQVKVVSGLGGIGKTQTARRYISQYFEHYNNFIWVDAESGNSMRNSFLKLAEEIQIPVKNSEGKSREIEEIVKEVYNKICEGEKSNLIVFDNAEDYQSLQQYLPGSSHPKIKKPVILATSRNQEWTSPHGKITVLPLDVLTDDESLEFILKELEIKDSPEFRGESREFIQLIGGLPLALQQAVAYIKQEKVLRGFLGIPYKISDYAHEFKSSMEKLMSFPPVPGPSPTVLVTWNVTLRKIASVENGKEAIKILNIISFLYADKIPLPFLRDLLPEIEERKYGHALKLLEKYSLIKRNDSNFSMSIHRQLQFVILHSLKEGGDVSSLVMLMLDNCIGVLEKIKLSKSSDIFLNLHQIVNNPFDLIPTTTKFLDFMNKFGVMLWRASGYSESLDVYKKVYISNLELLGESHEGTLNSQYNIALQLDELGKYDEALNLYEEILKKQEIHPELGVEHPSTIATKHNMTIVLRHQKKYQESLQLFQEVLAQHNKILGEQHPQTLSTQGHIAGLYLELGNFSEALELLQELEKKQVEILGYDHINVVTTKHNKASVLLGMGKLEHAYPIFLEVYDKKKKLLGENHLDTINTLASIASILEQIGKLEEALNLYKNVYLLRKMALGENHPQTMDVKSRIIRTEFNIKLFLGVERYTLYFVCVCAVVGLLFLRRIL